MIALLHLRVTFSDQSPEGVDTVRRLRFEPAVRRRRQEGARADVPVGRRRGGERRPLRLYQAPCHARDAHAGPAGGDAGAPLWKLQIWAPCQGSTAEEDPVSTFISSELRSNDIEIPSGGLTFIFGDTMFMAATVMVLPWKIVEDFQSFVKKIRKFEPQFKNLYLARKWVQRAHVGLVWKLGLKWLYHKEEIGAFHLERRESKPKAWAKMYKDIEINPKTDDSHPDTNEA